MATLPDRDLCGDGDIGTGESPPCEVCIESSPYTYADTFDYFWPETITSVKVFAGLVELPNPANVVRFLDKRLRVNFCSAPQCFTVVVNNQCTVLAFERADCPGDPCSGPPPNDVVEPSPPPSEQLQAAFIQFRHENVAIGLQSATNLPGVSDARYRYDQYSGVPRDYIASSITGAGGGASDHIGPSSLPMLVRANITVGVGQFIGWRFENNAAPVLGFTPSGVYSPADLPPTFTIGGTSAPIIGFLVPPGREIIAIAQFGRLPIPVNELSVIGIGNTDNPSDQNRGRGLLEFPLSVNVVPLGFVAGTTLSILYFNPITQVVNSVMATINESSANIVYILPTFANIGLVFFPNVDIKIRITSGPSAGDLMIAGSTVAQTITQNP